jgi:cytidyltransferase-like protein
MILDVKEYSKYIKSLKEVNNYIPTITVSGYFDPLHIGHVEYFHSAKTAKLGTLLKLIVIVNNDKQAILKKKKSFMPFKERLQIIDELRIVDFVIPSIDTDKTVIKTLKAISPDYFGKGGDKNVGNIPEKDICDKCGIKIIDRLGDKIQSSSWLISGKKESQ